MVKRLFGLVQTLPVSLLYTENISKNLEKAGKTRRGCPGVSAFKPPVVLPISLSINVLIASCCRLSYFERLNKGKFNA
jgi:hypothetical protein